MNFVKLTAKFSNVSKIAHWCWGWWWSRGTYPPSPRKVRGTTAAGGGKQLLSQGDEEEAMYTRRIAAFGQLPGPESCDTYRTAVRVGSLSRRQTLLHHYRELFWYRETEGVKKRRITEGGSILSFLSRTSYVWCVHTRSIFPPPFLSLTVTHIWLHKQVHTNTRLHIYTQK